MATNPQFSPKTSIVLATARRPNPRFWNAGSIFRVLKNEQIQGVDVNELSPDAVLVVALVRLEDAA